MLGNTKDIKQAVRATEQRVETTEKLAAAMRTDTAAIRKQLADPEQFDADRCPDVRCAVAMGASRKALQRFLDDGVRLPPEILGAALARLVESRNRNRIDVVDLYLSLGIAAPHRRPLAAGDVGRELSPGKGRRRPGRASWKSAAPAA